MRPGPVLLLLGLGLSLSGGPGRRPPTPAPRGASATVPRVPGSPSGDLLGREPASARRAPPEARVRVPARTRAAVLRSVRGARGLGVRGVGVGGGRARLSLRPRAAPVGGAILSGGRDLCLRTGRLTGPAPRCLRAHVLRRARRAAAAAAAAPARVDLQLSAPGGRLSLRWLARLPRSLGRLEWTFRLGLLGPTVPTAAAAAARVSPRSAVSPLSALPRGPRSYAGLVARTKCPTDGPTPVVLEAVNPNSSQAMESSVSCQISRSGVCVLDLVRIERNDDSPLQLTRKMEVTINATVKARCPIQRFFGQYWKLYSVASVSDKPDWTKPLQNPPFKSENTPSSVRISAHSLSWGVYLLNFSVYIVTYDPKIPLKKDSDSIYIIIVKSPLQAVIPGDTNITVNFTDGLTLNGNMSSDPDAENPLEGLHFFWYCTTDPRNYDGHEITVRSKEVCLPEQVDLSMKTDSHLQADQIRLREHLFNQSFILPVNTLVEISQVVMTVTKLTQKTSEFSSLAQKLATVRIWQASQALQECHQRDKHISSEQIESVSTGILTSLSNILKLMVRHEVVEEPFHVIESLAETVLAVKVPEDKTTAMRTSNFNMYVKKTEKWNVTKFFSTEKHCRNCFYPTLNVSSVPSLPANAPISTVFCEFADDPFPWLNYGENILTEVVGFRMTGTEATGDVIEITPDVVEVYLIRKNLSFGTFNLTVGPSKESPKANESLRKTTGAFSFDVDSRAGKEVLIHIVTEVAVLFTVLVYAGHQITPTALIATYLVPHRIPPVAQDSDLFDPDCTVTEARVVCLPPSLLRVIAQRTSSSESTVAVVLQAPHFVLKPNDKLVRISVFSTQCLDMYGIQSDWREDTCVVGEKTTWEKVHCICKNPGRARRQLDAMKLANLHLRTHYLTAKVIVVPNPVDLRLEVIKNVTQNPVTLFTVLFIMLLYIVLGFWALHRDEMDKCLREHVVVLPDNDPYDNVCYLVTVFTGSRCGSGTRANVFVQLQGTESSSDVHCLSHPQFTTLYRGSISTFLLTTKNDLGDIHSIRVWHNNEGRSPSWYLSRIKVENLFSRHIWLFMCREWLSIDTSLDRTFQVTPPDKSLNRMDFFLTDLSYRLGRSHMWFSVFSGVIATPFSRLQRLSCCLAMLLSSLLCNIMFFNLNKEKEAASQEGKYLRSMAIGMESVLITIPVQLMITSLFIYSQRRPQVTLREVAPRKHPWTPAASEHWEERLAKWHAHETGNERSQEPEKLPPTRRSPGLPKASVKTTSKRRPQPKRAESKVSRTQRKNKNANNPNVEDNQSVSPGEHPRQPGATPLKEKTRIVLPWCCVYVAWLLVFVTCSISSFFIVFYGLTYGYKKSIEWLFASFCCFLQSVFLVQPSKIIVVSGYRTSKPKYCENLPWVGSCRYSEIELQSIMQNPEEMRRRQQHIVQLRSSRMYQPLTEDDITIFKRKKRIKRRAFLFLSYVLTHFMFLALLVSLVTLLHHTDGFDYNRFIRDQFSVDLASVTKPEDIFRWLNSVLLPLLHNDLRPTFLPESSSKILGLPLMRQVRAQPGEKTCLPAEHFTQDSLKREIHCHPEYGTDPEDTKSYSGLWNRVSKRAIDKTTKGFTYKPREKRWVYYSYGLLHTYGSGGYAFYFFPEEQQFNSTLRLSELQGSRWLDEKTWAVILELTTFNPDTALFCSISVIFEVSRVGVVNTSLSAHSFSLADFNRKTSAEIYLYVAILIFFFAYVVDEVYIITRERSAYVKSVYNLLNFALKCIFTVLIVLFFRKHFLAVGIIRFYLSNSEDFIPFHAVSQVDHAMRVILGFLLFLTILKTLRYSRFFYHVRLTQRAIQTALPGICHMALVVSVYFFVYMTFGYLVFGQHEWNYSDMIHATQTVFSYCVSAFQNTEFSSNRVLGVLFLSSFLLVMICLLINLFQAVILSAYGEMKQPVYEEPSEEAEAMTYLCHRLRTAFGFLSFKSKAEDQSKFFVNMVYGQPEKNDSRYLGLKTRNINGKKTVYLVV
ncbi:hypothetical protein EI555_017224 [Monodon monoceros]|uniref:Polycystin family receptor for egg jelly n=1 Tax=Monodon monoceros TaxID=40151 RepID=A0A4U1EYH8_MONMO|nr:hypothetical protein EI555_017224 [Monodon monoceros]